MAFLLLISPFLLFVVPGVMIAVGGVVFSPVTGLISGLLARRKGLDVRRFTVVGVASSMMFGFPWLFLTFGMLRWNVPRFLIRMIYVWLYGAWLLSSTTWVVELWRELRDYDLWIVGWLFILVTLMHFGLWCVSLWVLWRTRVGTLTEWGRP